MCNPRSQDTDWSPPGWHFIFSLGVSRTEETFLKPVLPTNILWGDSHPNLWWICDSKSRKIGMLQKVRTKYFTRKTSKKNHLARTNDFCQSFPSFRKIAFKNIVVPVSMKFMFVYNFWGSKKSCNAFKQKNTQNPPKKQLRQQRKTTTKAGPPEPHPESNLCAEFEGERCDLRRSNKLGLGGWNSLSVLRFF